MTASLESKFATDRFLGHRKIASAQAIAGEPRDNIPIGQCRREIARLSAEVDKLADGLLLARRPNYTLRFFVLALAGAVGLIISMYEPVLKIAEAKVLAIVDGRLLKYAKDRTGLRNYAHAFHGADIIDAFTSPTFLPTNSPLGSVAWGPEVVISPGFEAGRCWSFNGSHGHVGISLSDQIVVTSVTIEHISLELAVSSDTAPKNIILWGYVEDPALVERYKTHLRDERIMSNVFPIQSSAMPLLMAQEDFVPLIAFAYDPYARDFLQTFKVPSDYVSLMIPVRHVVFHIQSNWGNELQTCVYRVRVHGHH